ncbi:MAG: diaminopimelate epimerase [Vicinamibacterales bacterium]
MQLIKAHALGNDFILIPEQDASGVTDVAALAREICDRHRGVGADGLMLFSEGPRGARMRLFNADGSSSELSGNGIRCLAAWLARTRGIDTGRAIDIETDAGIKTLEVVSRDGRRLTFRAAMGAPEDVQQRRLEIGGTAIGVVTMRVGNPQCVVLGDVTQERLHAIASKLSTHPAFPQRTNVELAMVHAPDRVEILIWERGVGPTSASGTGACAAAVAAMQFANANRDVQVVAPGGAQRVEWRQSDLFLTGWAEVVMEGQWIV